MLASACPVPSLPAQKRCLSPGNISGDPSHPHHGLILPLASGKRFPSICCRTTRFWSSFAPHPHLPSDFRMAHPSHWTIRIWLVHFWKFLVLHRFYRLYLTCTLCTSWYCTVAQLSTYIVQWTTHSNKSCFSTCYFFLETPAIPADGSKLVILILFFLGCTGYITTWASAAVFSQQWSHYSALWDKPSSVFVFCS